MIRNILDLADFYGRVMVPLAVISRLQHTTFSVLNEAGEALPRMTADEERFIVYCGLAFLVEGELLDRGEEMAPESRQVVWEIVHSSPGSGALPTDSRSSWLGQTQSSRACSMKPLRRIT